MIKAYHTRLTSSDPDVRMQAARSWARYELATVQLRSDPDLLARAASGEFGDVFARIEAHYYVNGGAPVS